MKQLIGITGKYRGATVTVKVTRRGERRQRTEPLLFADRRRGGDRRAPVWPDSDHRSVNP